jgi:hypothetical protein
MIRKKVTIRMLVKEQEKEKGESSKSYHLSQVKIYSSKSEGEK